MIADEQPIICDGFSSTGDAVVAGTSSNVGTDEGNDAGAAVGITFAVIVARRVEYSINIARRVWRGLRVACVWLAWCRSVAVRSRSAHPSVLHWYTYAEP